MFGLPFSSCQLIQGPAVRTWNCVAHFANLIWYKFNHVRPPIMPRSRRRHHSRSRTRSRSHSCDRDREPKRRKIESFESPQHKRSLSPESNEEKEEQVQTLEKPIKSTADATEKDVSKSKKIMDVDADSSDHKNISENESPKSPHSSQEAKSSQVSENSPMSKDLNTSSSADSESDKSEVQTPSKTSDPNTTQDSANLSKDFDDSVIVEDGNEDEELKTSKKSVLSKVSDSKITPKKTLSPKQVQKRLESEKKREEMHKEREKKKQEILEEKLKKQKLREEKEQQKLKEKQEKQEQKQKELEEKQKEKDLKEEKKKKEREEKEQKRKEKEEQKRKEVEEKNKEKQKQEEKKQKAAAVFANFFTKKSENSPEDKKSEEYISSSTFMPFEVKSDMRLAPILRKKLTDDQKTNLITALQNQTGKKYLEELKAGKEVGKSVKTWLPEDPDAQDDVIIVEDANPGESIEEQPKTNDKMRAKFLKFAGTRRPAYFGTWRKKSKFVKPRNPLALDKEHFDYEFDSDDDWEEEDNTGESLRGSDDEDKENESENEYEVDDEFFVPHGHLSEDEVNDEEDAVVSPEAHKAKLKLLKKEFEDEMKEKTQKIKPRVIGCIWYNKDQSNVDSAIREFLKPLSIISNGPVIIKKRSQFILKTPLRKSSQAGKPLDVELIPDFLKLIHGNTKKRQKVVSEFLNYLNVKNINADVSKSSLSREMKQFAQWMRCPEDGPLLNKFCWVVHGNVKEKFNVDLSLSNKE